MGTDVLQMWWPVCPDAGCRVSSHSPDIANGQALENAPFCSQFVDCWRSESGIEPKKIRWLACPCQMNCQDYHSLRIIIDTVATK